MLPPSLAVVCFAAQRVHKSLSALYYFSMISAEITHYFSISLVVFTKWNLPLSWNYFNRSPSLNRRYVLTALFVSLNRTRAWRGPSAGNDCLGIQICPNLDKQLSIGGQSVPHTDVLKDLSLQSVFIAHCNKWGHHFCHDAMPKTCGPSRFSVCLVILLKYLVSFSEQISRCVFLVWTGDGLIRNGGIRHRNERNFMTGRLLFQHWHSVSALMRHTVRCWKEKISSKWMFDLENFPIFTFLYAVLNVALNVYFLLMSFLLNVFTKESMFLVYLGHY